MIHIIIKSLQIITSKSQHNKTRQYDTVLHNHCILIYIVLCGFSLNAWG